MSMKSIWQWITNPFIWLARKALDIARSFLLAARKAGARLGLLAALAIGLASAGAGTYFIATSGGINLWQFVLPVKAIGVVLIAVGCFVSGWLAACFTASAVKLGDSDRDRLRKAESDAKEAEQNFQNEKRKRIEKEIQLSEVRKELDECAAKGINIGAIESVLQLAMAKSELFVTDFEGKWVEDSFKEGTFFNSPSMCRFVEVVRRPFEATFGLDLDDIRIVDHDGILLVDGLQAQKISSKPKPKQDSHPQPEQESESNSEQDSLLKHDEAYKWDYLLGAQLQRFSLKKVKLDEVENLSSEDQWKIAKGPERDKNGQQWVWVADQNEFTGSLNFDSKIFQKCHDDHLSRVEGEVYGTAEDANTIDNRFRFINETIVKMGKEIITKLLAPIGKEIKFLDKKPWAEGDHSNWKPLIEFCKQTNERLKLLENG